MRSPDSPQGRPVLRWGVLGTSFISEIMASAIARDFTDGQPAACVQAVAGRNPQTLAAFQQKFGVPDSFTDHGELIRSPKVDAVYIALPNHLHHEYVVQAARAGKPVLCEKSLSVDMPRTAEALNAVRQAGVFFMEGLMYLTHPVVRALVTELQSGVLGRLRMIDASYCAAISQFVNPQSRGAIYNLGCYPASLARLTLQACGLNSAVSDLRSIGVISAQGGNVSETSASLRFESGVLGRLHCAETYGAEVAGFSLVGELGRLHFLSNPWLPGAAGNAFVVEVYGQSPRTVTVDAEHDAYLYQMRHVREQIQAGHTEARWPAPSPADSRQLMQMLTRWEQDAAAHST